MRILIGNRQRQVKVTGRIREIIRRAGQEVAGVFKLPENTEVSITLLDDQAVRKLNSEYRHVDRPTDVLSFAFAEPFGEEGVVFDEVENTRLLGEIVISLERASAQAGEYGHSLEREIGYLTVHGLLHLLGFDHQDEGQAARMREWEEKILQTLKLSRD
ncbi:MAG: rRNA maturation RNase YbeY [Peptococcaceae bacterium]|jgi:probable rRNA maturation factor|nr:rRNA maturation RNase YbeY [Peptococcaceae bacterium]MDH7524542.1 rRNA maturation RNase YbeY [Peptococcaceae bacterium]